MGKNIKALNKKKIALIVIGIVVLLLLSGFSYLYYLLNKPNKIEIDESKLSINTSLEQNTNSEVTNIALFGIDAPEGVRGRSDAIMILSIDETNKKLKLSSIMRDSYVNIEGYGKDKITHAYAFGGAELAMNTLNQNFDLNISRFMTVNFTTLPKIIDALGGITVNITEAEIKYIPGVTHSGTQTLNGAEALAYSRIRYDGGDQMRTQRQRNVLEDVFDKLVSTSPTKIPSLLDTLLPLVDTNISPTEFMSLGTDVLGFKTTKISEKRFPCDTHRKGEMIKGVSYQTFNIKEETKEIHEFIYE
ncbi:MAG: LCP family protein [Clostridium chrysemydis]|uniref:LCP family protein n=1 Tax=Clostridium TaxID=1485 RepID=UPI0021535462|nr:LCP family protein [Clostridium sp. LY3-2]MCR6513710.1 LCP family protein [Clostridium sp. LY3-2]